MTVDDGEALAMIIVRIPVALLAILAGILIPLWVGYVAIVPATSHVIAQWLFTGSQTPFSQLLAAIISGSFTLSAGLFVLAAARTQANGNIRSSKNAAISKKYEEDRAHYRKMVGWIDDVQNRLEQMSLVFFRSGGILTAMLKDGLFDDDDLETIKGFSLKFGSQILSIGVEDYEFMGSLGREFNELYGTYVNMIYLAANNSVRSYWNEDWSRNYTELQPGKHKFNDLKPVESAIASITDCRKQLQELQSLLMGERDKAWTITEADLRLLD